MRRARAGSICIKYVKRWTLDISDGLYMIGGSPREIVFKSTASGEALLGDSDVRKLFEDSLESFAALAETDDVITVSVYDSGDYVYLDISRHKKNFPPVESAR